MPRKGKSKAAKKVAPPTKQRGKAKVAKAKAKSKGHNVLPTHLASGGVYSKSYMHEKGRTSSTMVLVGREMTNQLLTVEVPLSRGRAFDPCDSGLCPKLSAMASMFQRFRLRRLRLHWETTCSAFIEGQVGLAVHANPVETFANDIAQFTNSEYGCAGAVRNSFATPWWRQRSDDWFILPEIPSTNSVDPLKRFPCSLQVYQGGTPTADANKNAGFFYIEYEIEFEGYRQPESSVVYSVGGDAVIDVPDGEAWYHSWDWVNLAIDVGRWLMWRPAGQPQETIMPPSDNYFIEPMQIEVLAAYTEEEKVGGFTQVHHEGTQNVTIPRLDTRHINWDYAKPGDRPADRPAVGQLVEWHDAYYFVDTEFPPNHHRAPGKVFDVSEQLKRHHESRAAVYMKRVGLPLANNDFLVGVTGYSKPIGGSSSLIWSLTTTPVSGALFTIEAMPSYWPPTSFPYIRTGFQVSGIHGDSRQVGLGTSIGYMRQGPTVSAP